MPALNDVVIINLDRPRELRFGNRAIKQCEKLTGKSFFKINPEEFSAQEVEKILYCGLQQDAIAHGEVLKLEEMEELLDYIPYGEVLAKFTEAFQAAFGGVEDAGKNLKGIAPESQIKNENGPGTNR